MDRDRRSPFPGRSVQRALPIFLLVVALIAPTTVYGFTQPVPLEMEKITRAYPDMPPAANASSYDPVMTDDGRFIAFSSEADNLVEGDTNGNADIFLYDTEAKTTTLVSRASDGTQGNSYSRRPSISADGRFIAYQSWASNLVPGDTNGRQDVFVYDTVDKTVEVVSRATDGTWGNSQAYSPAISADGNVVAFVSNATNIVPEGSSGMSDVLVHDRRTGTTVTASLSYLGTGPNSSSSEPDISADGRYVVFPSWASDLVPGDTNGQWDVFVRDMFLGVTTRVSVAADGSQLTSQSYECSISDDGRYVAFSSTGTNVVPGDVNYAPDIFRRDLLTGTNELVSVSTSGTQTTSESYRPRINSDGSFVAFLSYANNLVPGDTNYAPDVFLRDMTAGTTVLVSASSDETISDDSSEDPCVSTSGDRVVFWTVGRNLYENDYANQSDIMYRDIAAGTTTLVTVGGLIDEPIDDSDFARISADGRYVVFQSYAPNLVLGDKNRVNDVFLHDRETDELRCVSMTAEGTTGDGCSSHPSISADGRYVAFQSDASDLIEGDTNGVADVFVYDVTDGSLERVSMDSEGGETGDCSSWPYISGDGNAVVFRTRWNLVPEDENSWMDVYVHYRDTGNTELVSVSTSGSGGNDDSYWPSPNFDGTIIAFRTPASDILPDDTNGRADIFVRDMVAGVTERVSVSTLGAEADECSRWPSISADGRYVAFQSGATNLLDDAPEGWYDGDIFVHDREEDTTIRITNGIDDGGIGFDSVVSGVASILGLSTSALEADNCSANPAISADGMYVVYSSDASNLVEGDTNGLEDVFMYEMATGETARVSVATDGTQGDDDVSNKTKPSVSGDGTYAAFVTPARTLIAGQTVKSDMDQVYVATMRASTPVLDPIANVTIDELTKLTFTATATGGDPESFVFSLGAGAPAGAAITPGGVFSWTPTEAQGPGTYTITVRLSDGEETVTTSFVVTVREVNAAPVFPQISNRVISEEVPFSFTAVAVDSDVPAQPVYYSLGDGAPEGAAVLENGKFSWTPTEAQGPGLYEITLIASDGVTTGTRVFTLRVTEANKPPVLGTIGSKAVDERSELAFTALATDPDVPAQSLTFSLGAGAPAGASITADGMFTWTPDEDQGPGVYDIGVVVSDGAATDTEIVTVTVGEVPLEVTTLAGEDRMATAVDVATEAFPEGAGTVLIATAYDWPDAICGSALAGALDAPILLTRADVLPDVVAEEIARLGATEVIILGGEGAVSAAVADELGELDGVAGVERISGANRYETAAAVVARTIAELGDGWDGTAFVSTGVAFPDALGASPLSAAQGWPIYLVGADAATHEAAVTAMLDDGVTRAVILGGEGAVASGVETMLADALGAAAVARLSGADRYETAAAVASFGVDEAGLGWNHLAIATGADFPDALVGGVLQGRSGSVMLLTPSATLAPATREVLDENAPAIAEVRFLGGYGAVSQAVRLEVADVLDR